MNYNRWRPVPNERSLWGRFYDIINAPSMRPPFTAETAIAKVRAAEDAWNSRDPERVSRAYSENSRWRNRAEFFQGRRAIVEFLRRKWAHELDYRLIKELWAFHA